MFHLVYISHASRPLLEEDLLDILSKSRQHNKKHHITGMLLYLNDKFIQVLEGKQDDVRAVYDKIREDSRHHKVAVVLEGNTEHRIFKNWSMGFKKLEEHQFEQLSGYRNLEDFFTRQHVTDESPAALIFLKLFYKKNLNDYPEDDS
jgi:Sensors of blue-light using FAD